MKNLFLPKNCVKNHIFLIVNMLKMPKTKEWWSRRCCQLLMWKFRTPVIVILCISVRHAKLLSNTCAMWPGSEICRDITGLDTGTQHRTHRGRQELVWTPDIDISRDHIQCPGYFYGNWWWTEDSCTSTLRIPGIVSYYTYLTVKLLSGFRTHGNTIKIVVQACGFQIVFPEYNICQWKDRKLHFQVVKTIICVRCGWTQSSVER